jgi:hypothetical protein
MIAPSDSAICMASWPSMRVLRQASPPSWTPPRSAPVKVAPSIVAPRRVGERGVAERRLVQPGLAKVGLFEVETVEVDPAQVGAEQVDPRPDPTVDREGTHCRVAELRPGHLAVAQSRAEQRAVAEDAVVETARLVGGGVERTPEELTPVEDHTVGAHLGEVAVDKNARLEPVARELPGVPVLGDETDAYRGLCGN